MVEFEKSQESLIAQLDTLIVKAGKLNEVLKRLNERRETARENVYFKIRKAIETYLAKLENEAKQIAENAEQCFTEIKNRRDEGLKELELLTEQLEELKFCREIGLNNLEDFPIPQVSEEELSQKINILSQDIEHLKQQIITFEDKQSRISELLNSSKALMGELSEAAPTAAPITEEKVPIQEIFSPEDTGEEEVEKSGTIYLDSSARKKIDMLEEIHKAQPCLIVTKGPDSGAQFFLLKQSTIIGRSANSEIILSDIKISRQHGRVDKEGNNFKYYDLGSTNGSFINGKRVSESRLKDGDVIEIGDTTLYVHIPKK